MIDYVYASMCCLGSSPIVEDIACLLGTKNDFSNIVSMMQLHDPFYVKYKLGDIVVCISSLPIHNPLEKGCLFNFVDRGRME